MSRWLSRSRIELGVLIAWTAALVAVALLSDSTTAFVAIVASGCGVAIVYQAARRRWWIASGQLALFAGMLLNLLTAGNHSQTEHKVVYAVSLVTATYFLVAAVAGKRASERSGQPLL